MKVMLDTCLVSEFAKKQPNPGVIAWMAKQSESDLLLTTMTLGEVVKGIKRLPFGPKRTELKRWYANDLLNRFSGRIVGLDEAASYAWGELCARLELASLPMPAVDSQIAAVCLLLGADVVTRNEADFGSLGRQGHQSVDVNVRSRKVAVIVPRDERRTPLHQQALSQLVKLAEPNAGPTRTPLAHKLRSRDRTRPHPSDARHK
jgi:toxin FitB